MLEPCKKIRFQPGEYSLSFFALWKFLYTKLNLSNSDNAQKDSLFRQAVDKGDNTMIRILFDKF